MHGLWQVGLAIPGDVSLIGFNDVFATRYMTPPLTTVGFDAAKIGEMGAQLVLKDSEADGRRKAADRIHDQAEIDRARLDGPGQARDGDVKVGRTNAPSNTSPDVDGERS